MEKKLTSKDLINKTVDGRNYTDVVRYPNGTYSATFFENGALAKKDLTETELQSVLDSLQKIYDSSPGLFDAINKKAASKQESAAEVLPKRRGRKPGSKNKSKEDTPKATPEQYTKQFKKEKIFENGIETTDPSKLYETGLALGMSWDRDVLRNETPSEAKLLIHRSEIKLFGLNNPELVEDILKMHEVSFVRVTVEDNEVIGYVTENSNINIVPHHTPMSYAIWKSYAVSKMQKSAKPGEAIKSFIVRSNPYLFDEIVYWINRLGYSFIENETLKISKGVLTFDIDYKVVVSELPTPHPYPEFSLQDLKQFVELNDQLNNVFEKSTEEVAKEWVTSSNKAYVANSNERFVIAGDMFPARGIDINKTTTYPEEGLRFEEADISGGHKLKPPVEPEAVVSEIDRNTAVKKLDCVENYKVNLDDRDLIGGVSIIPPANASELDMVEIEFLSVMKNLSAMITGEQEFHPKRVKAAIAFVKNFKLYRSLFGEYIQKR